MEMAASSEHATPILAYALIPWTALDSDTLPILETAPCLFHDHHDSSHVSVHLPSWLGPWSFPRLTSHILS